MSVRPPELSNLNKQNKNEFRTLAMDALGGYPPWGALKASISQGSWKTIFFWRAKEKVTDAFRGTHPRDAFRRFPYGDFWKELRDMPGLARAPSGACPDCRVHRGLNSRRLQDFSTKGLLCEAHVGTRWDAEILDAGHVPCYISKLGRLRGHVATVPPKFLFLKHDMYTAEK